MAGVLLGALCCYGEINGFEAKPTGNNPHSWNSSVLTNIVKKSSNVPKQMTLGTDPEKLFWLTYDFGNSGLDFSNTNKYRIDFTSSGSENELFGTGTFDTNGVGYCQFYFGNSSISNPNQVLTNNTPLLLTLVDNDSVYALDQELSFLASEGNVGEKFEYSGTKGEAIGTILKTLTVKSDYGTPNPGTVTVYPGTSSTQTIESVVSGPPGVRYVNIGGTLK